jgi:hypothetical protein
VIITTVEDSLRKYIQAVTILYTDELNRIAEKVKDTVYPGYLQEQVSVVRGRAHELLMLLGWLKDDMGTEELEQGLYTVYGMAVDLQGRIHREHYKDTET